MKKVALVMGSASDADKLKGAVNTLKSLSIPFEIHVYSAHRTPVEAATFARDAREAGFGVIIAAAGMAAHLAGVLAAHTTLPVIGLPLTSKSLDGLDALLATVQMPPGVPVACVGIDAAKNAAILAVQILAVEDPSLADLLLNEKKAQADTVLTADKTIEQEFLD